MDRSWQLCRTLGPLLSQRFPLARYLQLNIDKYEKSLLSQVRYGILPLRVETGRLRVKQEKSVYVIYVMHKQLKLSHTFYSNVLFTMHTEFLLL